MNMNLENTKQLFKCEECNKQFGRSGALTRHLLIHSKDTLKFNCEYENCNYSSNRKDSLQCHINRIHLKDLQCEYCDYKIGCNHSMKVHIYLFLILLNILNYNFWKNYNI